MKRLVRQAQAGSRRAFGALVKRCQDTLYRTAWAILRNDADASDAVQDTVLYCWKHLSDLREPRYFRTWITRIAASCSYDIARRRQQAAPSEAMVEEGAFEPGFDNVEWQMLLAQLGERSRLLIMLHYVDGFKVSEVGQILGVNENTVKSQLVAARRDYERLVTERSE